MTGKKSFDDKIRDLGHKWTVAVQAAFLVVRSDCRLVGMDRLRDPIIERAAAQAFKIDPPTSRILADVAVRDSVTAKIIDDLTQSAEAAARTALHKHLMAETTR